MSAIKIKTIVPDGGVNFLDTGDVSIESDNPSTSTTSGCLLLSGGLGINKNTNSSSLTSGGSITTSGGLAVARDTWIGGNEYMKSQFAALVVGDWEGTGGNPSINFMTENTGSAGVANARIQVYGGTSSVNTGTIEFNGGAYIFGSTGVVNINSATASSSVSTGALVLAGGIGVNNSTDAISSTNGGSFTTAGGMAIAKKLFVGSDLDVSGNITGDININRTGSIDRDINLKADDIITPEDFGAVGDGITDDSAAFQLALNTQKAVMCRRTTYLIGNLNIFWGTLLDGNGCTFKIVPGSDYAFNAYGWDTIMQNCRFDDPNKDILKTTTISSNALSGATTITLTSVTGMAEHMAISIKLNNRRPHVSFITGIVGNNVTIRHAIPANADAGNVVDAYYGIIKVGKVGEDTRYPKFFNLNFSNCSSAIYMGPGTRTEKAIYSDINIADASHACFLLKDCGNDCAFSNWIAFCGYVETDNYTGDGVTDTFQLTTAALIKTDITVTVNGVSQTVDVDFTYASDGSTLTFVVPPPLGQAVVISHNKPCDIGFLVDNASFATPYIGNMTNISVLHCWYGMKLYSTGLTTINAVLDGCNIGFYQKNSGTSIPTLMVGCILGFNGDYGAYIDTGVINTAFTGGLWTINASASPYMYNGILGKNIYVETGSTLYIDRDNWNFKDSGDDDSSIVENGTIKYMRNAARAEDGTVSLPTYSFRQDTDTGLYRVGANNMGVACGGAKILDISSTALDLTGAPALRANVADTIVQLGSFSTSNNPAINFYTANTGGLTTVPAKLQAYGGSASNNTGTLEANCASFVFGTTAIVNVNNTTAATSVSAGGSLLVQGGVRVADKIFASGNIYTNGPNTGTNDVAQLVLGPAPSSTNFDYCSQIRSVSNSGSNYGSRLEFYTHGSGSTGADGTLNMTIYPSGDILVSSTTASTDSSTGALILNGGLAIINTTEATSATNGGTITTAGGVGIAKKLFVGGVLNASDTTASTSNSTGAITTPGGLGISNTTEATSATNGGTITTAGGVGIAKKLFVGGALSVDSTAGNFIQFPRLTTTERDALTPADGMVVFNSTTSKLQCYASATWNDLF